MRKMFLCRFKCCRPLANFTPALVDCGIIKLKECRLDVTQAPCLVEGTTLLLMPSASNARVVVRSSAAIIFKAVCNWKTEKKMAISLVMYLPDFSAGGRNA